MLQNLQDEKAARDALLSLLPTSGTLAGIAVGLVSILNARPNGGASTFADDVLVFAALGFLLCCYLIYFAVGHLHKPFAPRLIRLIDVLYLSALTLVVLSGFMVVYEFV